MTEGCEFCRCYAYKTCELYQHIHDSKVPLEYTGGLHKIYSKKTLPSGLMIKRSEIPGAGLGVFAAVDIPFGTVFGPYRGKIHCGKIRGRSANFSWQIIKNKKHSHIVDASDPANSNWMRYVNCSRTEDEQNVTPFQHQWEIYYKVHQLIPAGTEILVFYGSKFGKHLGVEDQNVISSNRIRMEMRRNLKKAKRKSLGLRSPKQSSSCSTSSSTKNKMGECDSDNSNISCLPEEDVCQNSFTEYNSIFLGSQRSDFSDSK